MRDEFDDDELMDAVFLELQIQIRVGETTGTPMLLGNDFARLRLELAADLAAPRAVFEGLSQPVRQTKIFFFIAPSMIKIKPMWRQERGRVAPREGSRLNLQHSSETFHLSGPDSDRSIVAPPDGEFAAIEEGFENGA
jgi:hypothetical protein